MEEDELLVDLRQLRAHHLYLLVGPDGGLEVLGQKLEYLCQVGHAGIDLAGGVGGFSILVVGVG